jgi:hypothetical protein
MALIPWLLNAWTVSNPPAPAMPTLALGSDITLGRAGGSGTDGLVLFPMGAPAHSNRRAVGSVVQRG